MIKELSTTVIMGMVSISQLASADIYPGDVEYNEIVQRVYHAVSADFIQMESKPNITTRDQLCEKLVNRHNNHMTPGGQTNKDYLDLELTTTECVEALWYSTGYSDSS